MKGKKRYWNKIADFVISNNHLLNVKEICKINVALVNLLSCILKFAVNLFIQTEWLDQPSEVHMHIQYISTNTLYGYNLQQ